MDSINCLGCKETFHFSCKEHSSTILLGIGTVALAAISLYLHLNHFAAWKVNSSATLSGFLGLGALISICYLKKETSGAKQEDQPPVRTIKVNYAILDLTTAQNASSPLFKVPFDLVIRILAEVGSLKSYASLSLVCKKTYQIIHQTGAWQPITQQLYPSICFPNSDKPIEDVAQTLYENKLILQYISKFTLAVFGGRQKVL
jgi:hypothetical protein